MYISSVNQKGGVGKTTLTVNLGYELARLGHRCLLVDCDSQHSLTFACGIHDAARGLAEALTGAAEAGEVIREVWPDVCLLPASTTLAVVEIGLLMSADEDRYFALRDALDPVERDFDFILLDCPPALGLLTFSALCISDAVIAPVIPDGLAIAGLTQLWDTLDEVQRDYNPRLRVRVVLPSRYDKQTKLHNEALGELRASCWPVAPLEIGESISVAEAATAGQPVRLYNKRDTASAARVQEFETLAQGVSLWQSKRQPQPALP